MELSTKSNDSWIRKIWLFTTIFILIILPFGQIFLDNNFSNMQVIKGLTALVIFFGLIYYFSYLKHGNALLVIFQLLLVVFLIGYNYGLFKVMDKSFQRYLAQGYPEVSFFKFWIRWIIHSPMLFLPFLVFTLAWIWQFIINWKMMGVNKKIQRQQKEP